jgi:tRNA isopentenyl-2-thiomethyl-A-37 hydroxylase MiaE
VRDRRALAWLLNWYRQSELEGALLLGRMVRHAQDPVVVLELTRHAADEARHAWLWQRTIARLNLAPVRVLRSYQSFYTDDGLGPQGLGDVLALTHVFERRVDIEFGEQLLDPDLPEPVIRTFKALLQDEQRHLDWIARWLAQRPSLQPVVDRYSELDRVVAERLRPFRDCLWEVPGLGEELSLSTPNLPAYAPSAPARPRQSLPGAKAASDGGQHPTPKYLKA